MAPPQPEVTAPEITTVFQPLIDLGSGDVVGFEALTRGPASNPSPVPLLQAAAAAGQLVQFDDRCRQQAVNVAATAPLPTGLTWFLNTEPVGLDRATEQLLPDDAGLPIALEITERALSASPRALMQAAERVHERGWLLALDDVGSNPESLSLLPLIRPDVVKLDMRIVQEHRTPSAAAVANAVRAYAESTGATVLAEGIETTEHVEVALAYGATHGQGYLFGRPGPLPPALPEVDFPLARATQAVSPLTLTPYELASAARPTAVSTKQLLLAISRQLEWQVLNSGSSLVVLISVQDMKHWTPTMRSLYAELVERNVFTGVIGMDVPVDLQHGVRGSSIDRQNPISEEWSVIIIGPYQTAALTARDLGDDGPDFDRRFRYLVTYDRELVTAMARSMFHRLSEQVDSDVEVVSWS